MFSAGSRLLADDQMTHAFVTVTTVQVSKLVLVYGSEIAHWLCRVWCFWHSLLTTSVA